MTTTSPSAAGRLRGLRRLLAVIACAAPLAAAGCAAGIPSDPDGTLSNAAGGTLRVGVSADPPLVEVADARPSGPLVDLAEGFAESIDADPDWTIGSEETLVGMLEGGELDLVVGGFTDASPWADRAGVTRGYTGIDGAGGRRIVMLVPLGENAMLSALEGFLDEEVGS